MSSYFNISCHNFTLFFIRHIFLIKFVNMTMVIKMSKKFLISIFIAMLLGIFSAKIVYSKTLENNQNDNVYFLQLATYLDYDSAIKDTKSIENKLVLKENDKYDVFVGISKDKNNLEKIGKLYSKLGYSLYIKPKDVTKEEFLINLDQFDKLLKSADSEEEINTINSVILSSYEELALNPRN